MHGHGRGSAQAPGARRANGAGAEGRGRFPVRRKTGAVLRLLRGEGLEDPSRGRGVTAAPLMGWRVAFRGGGWGVGLLEDEG